MFESIETIKRESLSVMPKRKGSLGGGEGGKKPRKENVVNIDERRLVDEFGDSTPATVSKLPTFKQLYGKKKIQKENFFYHARWDAQGSGGNSKRVPPINEALFELMVKTVERVRNDKVYVKLTTLLDDEAVKKGIQDEMRTEALVVRKMNTKQTVTAKEFTWYTKSMRYFSPTLMVFFERNIISAHQFNKLKGLFTNTSMKNFLFLLLRVSYFELCFDVANDEDEEDGGVSKDGLETLYKNHISPVFRLLRLFFDDDEIRSWAIMQDQSMMFTLDQNLTNAAANLLKSEDKLREYNIPFEKNWFRDEYINAAGPQVYALFFGSRVASTHKRFLPNFEDMEKSRRSKQARHRIEGIVSPVKIQEVSILQSVHEFVKAVFLSGKGVDKVENWDDFTDDLKPDPRDDDYNEWLGSLLCLLQVSVGSRSNGIYGVNEFDPVYVKPFDQQSVGDENDDPNEKPEKLQEMYTVDYPGHLVTVRRLTKEKNRAAREAYEYFKLHKDRGDDDALQDGEADLDAGGGGDDVSDDDDDDLQTMTMDQLYQKYQEVGGQNKFATFKKMNKKDAAGLIERIGGKRKESVVPDQEREEAVQRAEDASLLRQVTKPLQHYFFNPLEMRWLGDSTKDRVKYLSHDAKERSINETSRLTFFRLLQIARDEIRKLSMTERFDMTAADWIINSNDSASLVLDHKIESRSVYEHYAVSPGAQHTKGFRVLCNYLRTLCSPLIKKAFVHLKGVSRATHELRRLYVCYAYYIFGSQNMKEMAFASRVLGHKHLDTSALYTSLQIVPTMAVEDVKMMQADSQKFSQLLIERVDAYLKDLLEKKGVGENDADVDVAPAVVPTTHVAFTVYATQDVVSVEKLKSERGAKEKKGDEFYITRCLAKIRELRSLGVVPSVNKLKKLGENRTSIVKAAFDRELGEE